MKVAVIGLGMGKAHLEAYAAIDGVRIDAVADLDQSRLSRAAGAHDIEATYTDYRRVLDAADIDAVSVCLPNHLHAPVAMEALEAGKHVLVEKPMARDATEAAQMADTAQRHNRTLAVAMNYRWVVGPDSQYLRQLTSQGDLGEVYRVRTTSLRPRTFPPGTDTWFSDHARSGGGALVDMGPHMLDLALWYAGDFEAVSVFGVTGTELMTDTDVDDTAVALIRLRGGCAVSLESTWASYGRGETSVTVYGTEGGAILDLRSPASQRLTLFSERRGTIVESKPLEGIQLAPDAEKSVQEHFVRSLEAGREPETSAACGLAVMRIIDAAYRSSATGELVQLD